MPHSKAAHVLIVHESESARSELSHALQAEGLRVTEAASSADAVREVWSGSFDAAVVSPQLPKVSGTPLGEHIRSLAPEIVTVPFTRDPVARLARKVVELLDGVAAA
jgi:DNA-binding response OmpR family regulator